MNQPVAYLIAGPGGGGAYPSTSEFVDRVFGKSGAFAYLQTFRNHLEFKVENLPTAAQAPIHEVFKDASVRVTSIAVDHDDAPALAYRIERGAQSIVVSGDPRVEK